MWTVCNNRLSANLTMTFMALGLLGCAESGLQRVGERPCPGTGGQVIETWCDEEGDCEFRVAGRFFGCPADGGQACTEAVIAATNACGGGTLDAGMVPSSYCDRSENWIFSGTSNCVGFCEATMSTGHSVACQGTSCIYSEVCPGGCTPSGECDVTSAESACQQALDCCRDRWSE